MDFRKRFWRIVRWCKHRNEVKVFNIIQSVQRFPRRKKKMAELKKKKIVAKTVTKMKLKFIRTIFYEISICITGELQFSSLHSVLPWDFPFASKNPINQLTSESAIGKTSKEENSSLSFSGLSETENRITLRNLDFVRFKVIPLWDSPNARMYRFPVKLQQIRAFNFDLLSQETDTISTALPVEQKIQINFRNKWKKNNRSFDNRNYQNLLSRNFVTEIQSNQSTQIIPPSPSTARKMMLLQFNNRDSDFQSIH